MFYDLKSLGSSYLFYFLFKKSKVDYRTEEFLGMTVFEGDHKILACCLLSFFLFWLPKRSLKND